VLQVQLGSGSSLSSLVVEMHLGREAEVQHGLLAFGEGEACLLGSPGGWSKKSRAAFHSVVASRGWALARFEPRITQVEGAAHTDLRRFRWRKTINWLTGTAGWSFLGPDGSLEALHKAIVDGHGHSVFDGAVSVPRPGPSAPMPTQMSRNLAAL